MHPKLSQVEGILHEPVTLSCCGTCPCGAPNWPALGGGAPPPCLGSPPPPPPPIGLGIIAGSANNPINIRAITIPPRMGNCMPLLFVAVDDDSPTTSCFFFLCS